MYIFTADYLVILIKLPTKLPNQPKGPVINLEKWLQINLELIKICLPFDLRSWGKRMSIAIVVVSHHTRHTPESLRDSKTERWRDRRVKTIKNHWLGWADIFFSLSSIT